ncbi:MAG TPA: DNA mismatch repair protein MutS [Candidatus Egerieenecus merdigallinarum]|nr:DNA mismatch repair protein MutS [Candidatus Egerieenecus merdigallinarum]
MAGLTPMMQQYMEVKSKYKDCILFYRLGDFYEMFFDDALTASRELELTLTGRDCGLSERAPMCGVPYHAVETYLDRLIEKGYKVAICEQMEDPALAKGLVQRDVIRVVTPGTVIESGMLDERSNNFLLSVCFSGEKAGLAFADVSTGEFFVHQVEDAGRTLADEVTRISPVEIIASDLVRLREYVNRDDLSMSERPGTTFQYQNASETLCKHFHLQDLSPLGLTDEYRLAAQAAGALMRYLDETQKNALEHITELRIYQGGDTMLLDRNTRRNLELTESLRSRTKKGSLLWLMDKTSTAMGGRLLRSWIEQPLVNREEILRRLDAVEEFTSQHVLTMTLSEELQGVYDVERLLSKVSYKSLNARDCLSLCASLKKVPGIRNLLSGAQSQGVQAVYALLDPLEDLTGLLERAIHPDAPPVISEGGIIRDGYSAILDEYRSAATNGKQWIVDLEAKERETTGIKNLRIQYNRVFGYYIEVTKSYYDMVPMRYQRRQTLANSERYITPELREIEQKIVGAQEQSVRLELQLFTEIREKIAGEIVRIQHTAQGLKTLDALLSLAKVAVSNHYVRPEITQDGSLEIIEGRHPVVEQTMQEGGFVPNDAVMDQDQARMLIITGPNMAGKSTYMRQVALITLMAHLGSFVPAKSAKIPIVDRIFTRVGASDDLASGQSTFMVEMSETAYILRNATRHSLIILDEIGRGTSTFDGLAIAWAVVEYLCDPARVGAKTLFATHYHELSELEGHVEGVQNYCISVKEHGEDVIFLRKIVRGGADRSFGIHVARLAGVPHPVLVRAHEIQARLEVSDVNKIGQNILEEGTARENEQVSLFDVGKTEIINELQNLDVMALTPIDAMNKLFLLREKARKL